MENYSFVIKQKQNATMQSCVEKLGKLLFIGKRSHSTLIKFFNNEKGRKIENGTLRIHTDK